MTEDEVRSPWAEDSVWLWAAKEIVTERRASAEGFGSTYDAVISFNRRHNFIFISSSPLAEERMSRILCDCHDLFPLQFASYWGLWFSHGSTWSRLPVHANFMPG